jgi:hypothetical protein
MAKKRYYESQEMYAGLSERRRMEMQDAGMIHEDRSQVANLPQEVIMKAYQKPAGYMPEDLDDTIRGIDRQISMDNVKKMKHMQPEKY